MTSASNKDRDAVVYLMDGKRPDNLIEAIESSWLIAHIAKIDIINGYGSAPANRAGAIEWGVCVTKDFAKIVSVGYSGCEMNVSNCFVATGDNITISKFTTR